MKAIVIGMLAASALSQAAEKEKVSIDEFQENKVLTGKLGKPFGTVMRVTCRGMAQPEGEAGRTKDSWWERTVEITAIDGERVKQPIVIEWSAFMTATVKKPGVGETLEVFGFESGGFEGSPPGAFQHVPSVADQGFEFVCTFRALKKVEPERQPK